MTIFPRLLVLALIAATGLLGGCATARQESLAYYDFGLPRTASTAAALATAASVADAANVSAPALAPVAVADIKAPEWLDTPTMYYRLDYDNDQQARPYAASRWNTPPAQLFAQRLKSRIAQAGGTALSASDGALNVPVLRIEVDEFMQRFTGPQASDGHVTLRVALLDNRRMLVAQRRFSRLAAAASPDAPGGVRALADASDAVITDIVAWLAGLPVNK